MEQQVTLLPHGSTDVGSILILGFCLCVLPVNRSFCHLPYIKHYGGHCKLPQCHWLDGELGRIVNGDEGGKMGLVQG